MLSGIVRLGICPSTSSPIEHVVLLGDVVSLSGLIICRGFLLFVPRDERAAGLQLSEILENPSLADVRGEIDYEGFVWQ